MISHIYEIGMHMNGVSRRGQNFHAVTKSFHSLADFAVSHMLYAARKFHKHKKFIVSVLELNFFTLYSGTDDRIVLTEANFINGTMPNKFSSERSKFLQNRSLIDVRI